MGPVEEAGPATSQSRRTLWAHLRPTSEEESEDLVIGAEFADDIFTTGHSRVRLSCSDKKAARLQYSNEHGGTDTQEPVPSHAVDMPTEEVQRLQAGWDVTLEAARVAANGKSSTAGTGFFGGMDSSTGGGSQQAEARIWPWSSLFCPLLTGRLFVNLQVTLGGRRRHRIRSSSASTGRRCSRMWPSTATAAQSARSPAITGHVVQPLSHYQPWRYPLTGLRWTSWAPFLVAERGTNILVVCDYATRYPEAIPMKSLDAEKVAEQLVTLFAWVGIPQKILTRP